MRMVLMILVSMSISIGQFCIGWLPVIGHLSCLRSGRQYSVLFCSLFCNRTLSCCVQSEHLLIPSCPIWSEQIKFRQAKTCSRDIIESNYCRTASFIHSSDCWVVWNFLKDKKVVQNVTTTNSVQFVCLTIELPPPVECLFHSSNFFCHRWVLLCTFQTLNCWD